MNKDRANLTVSSISTRVHNISDDQQGYSMFDWNRLCQTSQDLSGKGSAPPITVTAAELAQHDKEENAWTCVRGLVYNLTPFIKYHPGGKVQLMRAAGKDSSALFNKVHSWVNIEQMLSKCLLGVLTSSSVEIEASSEFHKELNSEDESLSLPVPQLK